MNTQCQYCLSTRTKRRTCCQLGSAEDGERALIARLRWWWSMRPIKAAMVEAIDDDALNKRGAEVTLSRLHSLAALPPRKVPAELKSIADGSANPRISKLLLKGAQRLQTIRYAYLAGDEVEV